MHNSQTRRTMTAALLQVAAVSQPPHPVYIARRTADNLPTCRGRNVTGPATGPLQIESRKGQARLLLIVPICLPLGPRWSSSSRSPHLHRLQSFFSLPSVDRPFLSAAADCASLLVWGNLSWMSPFPMSQ